MVSWNQNVRVLTTQERTQIYLCCDMSNCKLYFLKFANELVDWLYVLDFCVEDIHFNYTSNSIFFLFHPGQLYGLEKFWAFLKYYKHSSKLHVDPKLKECLSGYNDVKDFRVVMASFNFLYSFKWIFFINAVIVIITALNLLFNPSWNHYCRFQIVCVHNCWAIGTCPVFCVCVIHTIFNILLLKW